MKVRVLPSVDELVEVLSPSLWEEITDVEVRDLLQALLDCGFEISHEVEIDDQVIKAVEHALAHPETWVRGLDRPRRG